MGKTISVKGHYRTYNGKRKWIRRHPRTIKSERKPKLKEYAFRFSYSFPKGYVKKISAENIEEATALASSEHDSVLMDPECSGWLEYIGEWEDYKKKIQEKRAKSFKAKVKQYKQYGWESPYKKNWKYLKENTR